MISSATISDNVLIRANIRSIYRDRYHCEKERKVLTGRLNNPNTPNKERIKEQLAIRKLQKGCGVVLNKIVDTIENINFYTCLCELTHPLIDDLIFMYNQFDNGIMPFSGGLLEQPAQVIELLKITGDAKIKEDKVREKEWRKKSK